MTGTNLFGILTISMGLAAFASAQVSTNVPAPVPGAKPVTVEHIKVHGKSLEGNLEGDDVDREVIVFLPPSYAKATSRRYPVVYALHGFSIGAAQWTQEIHVPQTIEGAFAQGAQETIVVLPDSKNVYNGSMYSSSATTGDFESFIARDVVAYVDAHYRTIPKRSSRGLVGHSMGGYGASRIGMKHPEVFGSLYIMSPCCMSARGAGRGNPSGEAALAAAKTPAEAAKIPGLITQLAVAAAWSPNPKNPPLYFDMPTKDGRERSVGFCRPVHRQFEAVPGRRDGRRRPGHVAGRRGQTARYSRRLRHPQYLRGLSRHSHQRRGRPLPEPRHAVFRQEFVLRQRLPVSAPQPG
jgi:enterochelin esterase-like enzyme